jgi:hypothetical protein
VCAVVTLGVSIAGSLLSAWRAPLLAGLAVAALGLFLFGAIEGDRGAQGVGLLGLILVGLGLALALQIEELGRGDGRGQPDAWRRRMEQLVETIREHSMLSDTAKRALFRGRELELLRKLIEEDLGRGEYHAALRLCDDMAELFGYREEAESFRSRINRSRHADYQAQVGGAMEELAALLAQRDWPRAHEMAARIRRLFPEAHVQQEVDARMARVRLEHKEELERAFLDAAQREDVELAMKYLRQLDRYITSEESGRLQEIAQDVVTKHKSNLGVQFKLAVNDHRWVDAARIGDAIMNEFPNSKMAGEVKAMIDVLRTRASATAVALHEER